MTIHIHGLKSGKTLKVKKIKFLIVLDWGWAELVGAGCNPSVSLKILNIKTILLC